MVLIHYTVAIIIIILLLLAGGPVFIISDASTCGMSISSLSLSF